MSANFKLILVYLHFFTKNILQHAISIRQGQNNARLAHS
jgi:hypothetical protein